MSNEVGKKKKSLMIPMRIFCLLLAVVIWILVVNITSDSFEDTFEVDIRVEGNDTLSDQGISVYDRSESKVSVLVRGKRDKIRALQSSDFRAYIDVSTLESAGKHNVDVKISVPEEVAVVSYSPATVEISIDRRETRSELLEVEFKNYSKERNFEIRSYRTDPQVLTVTGPLNILNRIANARLISNLGGISLSDSFENLPESIVLLDEKGNVIPQDFLTFSTEQIHVYVTVDHIRSVPLSAAFAEGFDASGIASVEITPASVELKGEKYLLDAVSKLPILTVGEDTPDDTEVPLSKLVLPEGIGFQDPLAAEKTVKVHIRRKPVETAAAATTDSPELTSSPEENAPLNPQS